MINATYEFLGVPQISPILGGNLGGPLRNYASRGVRSMNAMLAQET